MCKFTLRIKQLFLNFVLHLINDFEDYYKKEAKYDMNKDNNDSKQSKKVESASLEYFTANKIFDFKKYTRSENLKEFRERFA